MLASRPLPQPSLYLLVHTAKRFIGSDVLMAERTVYSFSVIQKPKNKHE